MTRVARGRGLRTHFELAGRVAHAGLLMSLLGATGCGGGDEGGSNNSAVSDGNGPGSSNGNGNASADTSITGLQGGGSSRNGDIDVCRDRALSDFPPTPRKPTGTAHLKPSQITSNMIETDLKEITCEASRDEQGRVVGFLASFADDWDYPGTSDIATVSWRGVFAGPGQYEGAKLRYHYGVSPSAFDQQGTLVIGDDGLSGSVRASNAELSFQCGDDSKLSLETVPWPPLAKGTARGVGADGVVYEFPGITCGTSNGDFRIETLRNPFDLRVTADGVGTGSHSIKDSSISYSHASVPGLSGNNLTLDCAANPVSGTIGASLRFACQR